MSMIGEECEQGFSLKQLEFAQKEFQRHGCRTELHALHEECNQGERDAPVIIPQEDQAWLLVVRGGVDALLTHTEWQCAGLVKSLASEEPDKHLCKKSGQGFRVMEKRQRWNLMYGDDATMRDYEHGRSTVIAFSAKPPLAAIRDAWPRMLGSGARKMVAELNVYFDVQKCGIGWHGDSERSKVAALRLGAELPLAYQWFHRQRPVGRLLTFSLRHGDVYVMSDRAVGRTWLREHSRYTLRHAAGSETYIRKALEAKMRKFAATDAKRALRLQAAGAKETRGLRAGKPRREHDTQTKSDKD